MAATKSITPRCDEFDKLHKYFMSTPTPSNEFILSKSAAYISLLRLARSLETELSDIKQKKVD